MLLASCASRPRAILMRAPSPAVFVLRLRLLPAPVAAAPTTAAASTTAAPTAITAAAARTGALLASLIHLDVAALEFGTVEFRDSARRFIGISHLHKAKASRLTGELVGNNGDIIDLAHLSEERFQILVGDRKGQIA